MKIVKFCNKQHNPIVSSTTIQVCTVLSYRATNNTFIRDVDEGRVIRNFQTATPVVCTADEIARMTGWSIGGDGTVLLEGRAVSTDYSLPNAYVFCTSYVDRPTSELASTLGYNSHYIIKDARQFCEAMREAIRSELSDAREVVAFCGRVEYRAEKEIVFDNLQAFAGSHRVIEPWLYILKRMTSREDNSKRYDSESEYRFVFVPVNGENRPIALNKDKLYIGSEAVKNVLSFDLVLRRR